MTRLPDLRDELIRAARRQDARRRRLSWRPLAAGAVVAITVSGAALAATGSRVPVLAGLVRDVDGTPLVPKHRAAVRRLALEDQVLALINRANEDVFSVQPRCRPPVSGHDAGRTTHAVPPRAALRLVAAFRRPSTAAERRARTSGILRGLPGVTYIDYVRGVSTADHLRFTVAVSRSTPQLFRPKPGCLEAQNDRLRALVAHRGRRLRIAALRAFGSFRYGQENNLRAPTAPRTTVSLIGAGAGPLPLRAFETRGLFSSGASAGEPVRLTGLVPDGVAQITIAYPRDASRGPEYEPRRYASAYRRTFPVTENMISVAVPRSAGDALTARLTWRDRHGRVLRVVDLGR